MGASSLYAEFGPVSTGALNVAYGCDGVINAAKGVRGGLSGARANQGVRAADGKTNPLPAWGQVLLNAGERVFSSSCGGGGYGSPYLRDAQKVVREVHEGWISPERALSVYGVVLLPDGALDARQTSLLRSAADKSCKPAP